MLSRSVPKIGLLDLDLGARLFQLGLGGVGLLFGDALLDRLRRSLDQILGLLEAEARQLADGLDDLDLVRAGLGENDIKLGLLFLSNSRATTGGSAWCEAHRHRRSGRDAPLLFERLHKGVELENGHALKRLDQLRRVHDSSGTTCCVPYCCRLPKTDNYAALSAAAPCFSAKALS